MVGDVLEKFWNLTNDYKVEIYKIISDGSFLLK